MKNVTKFDNRSTLVSLLFNMKDEYKETRSIGEVYMLLTNIIFNSVANFSSLQLIDEHRLDSSVIATIKIDHNRNQHHEFMELVSENEFFEKPVYCKVII